MKATPRFPALKGPLAPLLDGLGNRARCYGIPWPAVRSLARCRFRLALRALESLRARASDSELVFGGSSTSRSWFEPVVKVSGLNDFTWHCLRHTFASRLVMTGVDIRTVQELLGTIGMTVRYSHLAPKHTLADGTTNWHHY
jgi:integrase